MPPEIKIAQIHQKFDMFFADLAKAAASKPEKAAQFKVVEEQMRIARAKLGESIDAFLKEAGDKEKELIARTERLKARLAEAKAQLAEQVAKEKEPPAKPPKPVEAPIDPELGDKLRDELLGRLGIASIGQKAVESYPFEDWAMASTIIRQGVPIVDPAAGSGSIEVDANSKLTWSKWMKHPGEAAPGSDAGARTDPKVDTSGESKDGDWKEYFK